MSDLLYEVAKAEQPSADYEDVMEEAHRTAEYLSRFDDSYEVWDAVDSRGHMDGNFTLEDIYSGRELDCQGRANAVALYEDTFSSGEEIHIMLQYNKDNLLWIDLTTDNHATPVIDGEAMDSLNGRQRFETLETDRIPDMHTIGLAYQTFEEEDGADLPVDYLVEEADRILEEESERPPGEQSELVQVQAEAIKTTARITSLPGPFSKALDLV